MSDHLDDDLPSGTQPKGNGMAVASLVLGLLSFCTFITAFPGVILGIIAVSRPNGKGLAIGGIISSVLGMISVPVVAILFALLLPAIQKVREADARVKVSNNFKQVGVSLHNHASSYNDRLPSAWLTANGKPGLSWRVQLTPYMPDDGRRMSSFAVNEPWDSPTNQAQASRMPAAYRGDPANTTATDTPVRVFVGPGTLHPRGGESTFRLPTIPDGTSNTVFAVEATDSVPWMAPQELQLPSQGTNPDSLLSRKRSSALVLMMDGSVRSVVPGKVSERTWRQVIDPSDGNVVGYDW